MKIAILLNLMMWLSCVSFVFPGHEWTVVGMNLIAIMVYACVTDRVFPASAVPWKKMNAEIRRSTGACLWQEASVG